MPVPARRPHRSKRAGSVRTLAVYKSFSNLCSTPFVVRGHFYLEGFHFYEMSFERTLIADGGDNNSTFNPDLFFFLPSQIDLFADPLSSDLMDNGLAKGEFTYWRRHSYEVLGRVTTCRPIVPDLMAWQRPWSNHDREPIR